MAGSPGAELVVKLRLERKLSAQLKRLFGSIGRQLEGGLGPVGGGMVPPIVQTWQPVLTKILLDHYAVVARAFTGHLPRALPEHLRPNEAERRVTAIVMGRVFSARAEAQAKIILETAQRRVARSVGRASEAIAQPNSGLTSADLPRLAARDWVRRQVVQARASATFETQTAAETSKAIEVARLVGERSPVQKDAVGEPNKVWQTQGDSRVRGADGKGRFDHFDADGQRVPISEAFLVSGEHLRWPGDRSLGASDGNIYGCRCSAIYEADSVAELRSLVMERIRLDVTRFVQTESDVVVSLPFLAGR